MARRPRVALAGPQSLLGRELRDLASQAEWGFELKLLAGDEQESGQLLEEAGEPTVAGALNNAALEDVAAVFLAGTREGARKALQLAPSAALIDLTYAAEESPRARLRAPLMETEAFDFSGDAVHVIAHPAAVTLALILDALHREFPILRSVAHVLEPASEHGRAGIDELQQQTVGLLSFKGLEKKVFDAQLSFNLLAVYGEEAPHSLQEIEDRVDRHLATLLTNASAPPRPSLRLIQAPVFHGHSLSLWVEFEDNPGPQAIEQALSGECFDVRAGDAEAPTIVGIAGQDEIGIGAVAQDRNSAQACWVWAVSDNVRLAARSAMRVAQQVVDSD